MVQIGNVPDILAVKKKLADLQAKGLITEWALPYENLLTRLDAAIFFLNAKDESALKKVWGVLGENPKLKFQENTERTLSELPWRFQFKADV